MTYFVGGVYRVAKSSSPDMTVKSVNIHHPGVSNDFNGLPAQDRYQVFIVT